MSFGYWGLRTAAGDVYHQIDEWGNHARDGHWDYADPDVDDHMNGNCWDWAIAHQGQNPHLRIGQEWHWQEPEERDHPEDEWIPIHAFTHDDHWAYDARGAFPLSEWRKWKGWDDVTFNHEPWEIGGWRDDKERPLYPSLEELVSRNKPKPPLPVKPEIVKGDDGWRIASANGVRYAAWEDPGYIHLPDTPPKGYPRIDLEQWYRPVREFSLNDLYNAQMQAQMSPMVDHLNQGDGQTEDLDFGHTDRHWPPEYGREVSRQASTDSIRYAHVVEADVADDLRRLAMAWDQWAPQVNGGCEGGCDHDRMTMGEYSISHPDGTGPQVGDLLPGIKGRSLLQFNHDTDQNGNPEIYVSGIHVDEGHRRDGIAEALMRRLHRDHPDTPINPGFMTDMGQGLLDGLKKRIPHASDALVPRHAAVNQELVDRLHREFHDWYGVNADDLYFTERNNKGQGPLGHWPNIEEFLSERYPAAHRDLDMGMEAAQPLMDGQERGLYGDRAPDAPPYETGPEAEAKHGYDPKEIAATMLLLHNGANPQRGDMAQHDQDRLNDIARKRFDMQRDYEQRNARIAMGLRGDLPEGLTFQYHEDGWEPYVTAHVGDREVGNLFWFAGHPDEYRRELLENEDEGTTLEDRGISGFGQPVGSGVNDENFYSWPNTVSNISVDEDMQRRGVGLAMFDHVKKHHNPDLMHSFDLSPSGRDFSRAERARRTARAPWNPAGTPLFRGVRVKWSPDDLEHLHGVHASGDHQALAHSILDRIQTGSRAGEWNRPREGWGGLGVFWSGDRDVSHGYSHHGDGHDPDPAGPFENVVLQTDGGHDPAHEWTPYDEDEPHDWDLNELLNEDRETDLVEGAPVNVTHVHVNGPDGRLSIPLNRGRRLTAAMDPFDAQQEAMADVMHLRHYADNGTHPDIGGFDPGRTVSTHPMAHHPLLTNHWAAEVVRPDPTGDPFGHRVQASTDGYVRSLVGVAQHGPDHDAGGAGRKLEDSRNGLRVELQHAGHITVPHVSDLSPLPRPADARRLSAVNPRHLYGMEGDTMAHHLGYQINCQRAVLALDARHRGHNVEARPNRYDPNDPDSDKLWADDDLAMLWHDRDGNPAPWVDAEDHFQFTGKGPRLWDAMHDEIASWGPRGRAIIGVTGRDPSDPSLPFRHVIFAHGSTGGRVHFVDPQSATPDVSDWRDRIMYEGHEMLFTPADRARAAQATPHPIVQRMVRNFMFSPLRFLRTDDAELAPHAAQHLVDRGTADARPIYPMDQPKFVRMKR